MLTIGSGPFTGCTVVAVDSCSERKEGEKEKEGEELSSHFVLTCVGVFVVV